MPKIKILYNALLVKIISFKHLNKEIISLKIMIVVKLSHLKAPRKSKR